MEVNKREVEGVLVVDLEGQFPTERDQIENLGDRVRDAISGASKPIIFHVPDADRLTNLHIGALLRAIKYANVSARPFSIVSPDPRIREVFRIAAEPLFRVYETEDEAIHRR